MDTSTDTSTELAELHANWKRYVADTLDLPTLATPLNTTKEQWKEHLDRSAYQVLFKDGTERAGSSELDSEYRKGVFLCAACELPLFTSAMKFDSGTGWPSFFTSIPDHLETSTDYKLLMPRTEYHCARCKGHQGHVFNDGPQPSGQRWCNNGVAVTFVPIEA